VVTLTVAGTGNEDPETGSPHMPLLS